MLLLAVGLIIIIAGRSPGLYGPAARLAGFICMAVGAFLSPFLWIPSLLLVAAAGPKGVLLSLGIQAFALIGVLGLVSLVLKRSFLNIRS